LLQPAQKQRVEAVLERLKSDSLGRAPGVEAEGSNAVIERRNLTARAIEDPSVVYYAGAVAMMFLLFSSLQGAMQIIDERHSGVLDRVLFGAGGGLALIAGKFVFLMMQGVVQAALIFVAASWAYGLAITADIPAWLLITVAASALAAGFGLLLSAAARSRQQAQTLSTFIILILAALGGSMVPRFLMPSWLQDISWAVPNAWIVEAYHGLLWRAAPIGETLWLIAPAAGVALACLVSAMALLHTQARH
jgi:ABC-2 type transport system permease protein